MNFKKKNLTTLGLLLSLYVAQGLPTGFMTQALPAILREYNVSLQQIGWTGLLMAPWALKFIWAPFVDKYHFPKIGRSKSWVIPLQLLSAGILITIAWINPADLVKESTLQLLFAFLFFMNLFGATQDIATDGLSTRLLDEKEQSDGSAVQVFGSRFGLIVGGGVFLMLMGYLGWRVSFFGLAGLIILNTLPILFYKEPQWEESESKHLSPSQWIKEQYGYFFKNKEMVRWVVVLCCFKIADGLSSGMVKPMMKDMGISLGDIGLWGSIIGSAAALVGAGLAAWIMKRLARDKALVLFNAFQAITTGAYAIISHYYYEGTNLDYWTVFGINAIEHLAAAMALVAMLSFVLHYSRETHAGSDFTFQVCILAFTSGIAHIISGYVAHNFGYTALFGASMIVGLVLLIPILRWERIYR